MHDNCQRVLRELRTFLDGECHVELERLVVEHLHDCEPCYDRAEFERRLRLIVARKCQEQVPDGLLERVIANLSAARD